MKKILYCFSILFLTAFSSSSFAAFFEFEEDRSLPLVHMNLIVDVGAAQDPTAKLGLASVAGRMMLRGTEKKNKSELDALFDLLGAQIEVFVQTEGTIFRMVVLSKNLTRFLAVVEEIFLKPQFIGGEFAKVKKEIEGEILEQRGNDNAQAAFHFTRFFYEQHPYGNPILGTLKGLEKIVFKDVVDYYATNYGDPRLAFFASGAAKKEELETWFNKLRKALNEKNPKVKPVVEMPAAPTVQGKSLLLVNKPRATQSQVYIGGNGMRPEAPGFYAVQLANYSFGGHSFNAKLMTELRVKRGWTYGASCNFRFGRQAKHYSMFFFPKTGDTIPAIQLSLQLLNEYATKGITEDEFDFAKKSLVKNAPFNYDTPKARLENATQEYLLQFPKNYFRDFGNQIDKVKYDEVLPAVKEFYKVANLKATVLGDSEKLRPELKKIFGSNIKTKHHLDE